MPIYDVECKAGHITERFMSTGAKWVKCVCGQRARKIISVRGQHVSNQDAPWLRSVLDVVDRDSKKPHVQAFVRNPTRENYHRWMRGEGIRPLDHTEHGGPPTVKKPEPVDLSRVRREVYEKFRKRRSLEVRS